MTEKNSIIRSFLKAFWFVAVLWLIAIISQIFDLDFTTLGIYPGSKEGLIGILTAPLIHGGWMHLGNNSGALLILGTLIFIMHPTTAKFVYACTYLFTGVLVWYFSTSYAYHIGASGVVFGLAAFLFFSGLFRNDISSLVISLVVLTLYGGIFLGVLPGQPGISWESHLFGALIGMALAYVLRNTDKPKKPNISIMNEEITDDFKYQYNRPGTTIILDEKRTEDN